MEERHDQLVRVRLGVAHLALVPTAPTALGLVCAAEEGCVVVVREESPDDHDGHQYVLDALPTHRRALPAQRLRLYYVILRRGDNALVRGEQSPEVQPALQSGDDQLHLDDGVEQELAHDYLRHEDGAGVQDAGHDVHVAVHRLHLGLHCGDVQTTHCAARQHLQEAQVVGQQRGQVVQGQVFGGVQEGRHQLALLLVLGVVHTDKKACNLLQAPRGRQRLDDLELVLHDILVAHVGDGGEQSQVVVRATVFENSVHQVA
mmetsp:Transcript_25987/g.58319  ORF Transcript_25987/g.58319 Transcript_25987/m.58319 type:complete len:260 (-) Transcript_25987:1055-1834(-)